jgi:hypothetical protein
VCVFTILLLLKHYKPFGHGGPSRADVQKEKKEEAKTQNTDNSLGCYMRVLGRDTFVAKLQQSPGEIITGNLSFDNFEKDASSGKVSGKEQDGIISLWYTFHSEGIQSVMEVYFKKTADGLIRGIGDMKTRGDTAYFVHPQAISYPEKDIMKKIPCSDIPIDSRGY